ncbi:MAG: short-chain dehydrogenase [Elusimicrobia bacterium GWC2_65_9]|nr:MAG: short-chain dehydrogenase [Elusimicrobia bacterium GWA2_66_18]OGR69919.1 MAG: short-chain dehydrogenase [Elusimicrobia bacterium GWC2_65_9]
MGRAAVVRFSREGARVVAADVDLAAVRESVALAETAGGKAFAVRMDVSKEAEVRVGIQAGVKAYGKIDVLYNNAGIFPAADHSVTDTDEAVWDKVFAVNVKGVYLVCKHGIPELLASGGGSVINVASFVALVGCSVPQDAYTASKGAVLALTKSLAVQFGPKGVRSNAICPGPIETPLLAAWLFKEPAEKTKRLNRIPLGRFGKSEDIVNMALFLASDESSWTNGASLVVDGGITSNYF